MILPPELLLDSLAGQSLPEAWRALLEPRTTITRLSTVPLVRNDSIEIVGQRSAPACAWSHSQIAPDDDSGVMIAAVRVPGIGKHLPESGVLPVTLVRGQRQMAQVSISVYYDGPREVLTPWSMPAVLIPIPPRQNYYMTIPRIHYWDLPPECSRVEFWGWPLTPGFWE